MRRWRPDCWRPPDRVPGHFNAYCLGAGRSFFRRPGCHLDSAAITAQVAPLLHMLVDLLGMLPLKRLEFEIRAFPAVQRHGNCRPLGVRLLRQRSRRTLVNVVAPGRVDAAQVLSSRLPRFRQR